MRPLLGTFVEIAIHDSSRLASRAFERAFADIERVHHLLSYQAENSDLSRLNRCAGQPVRLSALAIRVLRLGRAMTRASGGLFNCTIGGALVSRGVLPDHGGPRPLECGDATDLEIKGNEARLARPVRVTLDGIAKGYAVDLAIQALRRSGVRGGWVNAGGDMRAFGDVMLSIHRREPDGSLRALGGLRAAALATSEARSSSDPRFSGELFDPTGRVAPRGTWTVLASNAWRADALTKVAALAPAAQREALLARLGGRLVAAPALTQ